MVTGSAVRCHASHQSGGGSGRRGSLLCCLAYYSCSLKALAGVSHSLFTKPCRSLGAGVLDLQSTRHPSGTKEKTGGRRFPPRTELHASLIKKRLVETDPYNCRHVFLRPLSSSANATPGKKLASTALFCFMKYSGCRLYPATGVPSLSRSFAVIFYE